MRVAGVLSAAQNHLRACEFSLAAEVAAEALGVLPPGAPAAARRTLLNIHGVALHLLDDGANAHESLAGALQVALRAASSGDGGHDSYADVGGTLGDLAANHIRNGELDAADAALKRGTYMLKRAYRPSPTASACLLNVRGCLHEARGELASALNAHQEAHSLLLSVPGEPPPPHAGWLQACRHGSAWAMIQLGDAAAAEMLCASDARADRLAPLDARERALAQSRYAIASLQRLYDDERVARGDGDGGGRDAPSRAAPTAEARRAEAMRELHIAAEALHTCLGDAHAEVHAAWHNLAVARAAIDATAADAEDTPSWQRHWQPALGAGLWLSETPAWQPTSATRTSPLERPDR